MSTFQTLTDMPNISFVLAENLTRVGIRTPAQLVGIGSLEGYDRLRTAGLSKAGHILLALEGAICGVPWQSLPRGRRHELLIESSIKAGS